jgi:DNA-binding MarR family transcriptional regulator
LARRLNLSLGKANALLNVMIGEGYIRMVCFKNAASKRAYRYDLTPEGLQFKWDLARRFLQVKAREYETLQRELELLRREINQGALGIIPPFANP